MYSLNNDFIGYPENDRYTRYTLIGKDAESEYIKNLSKNGPNWYYATNNFSYLRNGNGHRSKEITELDLDNYILCTGCSVTEGIGIDTIHRYTDIIADNLKCDMYNLALSASGNDIMVYNLVTWFNKIKKKPKFIVVQWTNEHRFSTIDNTGIFHQMGVWNTEIEEYLDAGMTNNHLPSATKIYRMILQQVVDVPIIEIYWNISTSIQSKYILEWPLSLIIDYGRDLLHPGIKSNIILASKLMKIINQL